MNKRIFTLQIMGWWLAISGLQAQVCGTTGAELAGIRARLLANKAVVAEGFVQPRSTQYVPVKFHLVSKNDGTGGVNLSNVLDQMCALNNDFRSFGIQFYIKDYFNMMRDDRLYSHHYNYRNMMETYRDPNAMNIWIVDNANPTGFEGYVAGYYTNSKDWLVIQKDEIKSFTFTLPHEVGHFFGLMHTFYGWETDPWQATKHGNPAPAMSPGEIRTENQDGSNCEFAGDYICDTPPDYGFGSYWTDCNYTGGAKDPMGTTVNPDESNFMSYFDACERSAYHFSALQKTVMAADLASVHRNHLRNAGYPGPAYLQFNGLPTLQLPVPGATTEYFNRVELRWTAVEGANRYLVELSTTPVFGSGNTFTQITADTSLIMNGLEGGKSYHWRVRPFNEYYTCTNRSERKSFRTGNLSTALSYIPEMDHWQLQPNPAHSGEILFLKLQNSQTFTAAVEILNLTGQVVRQLGEHTFPAGTQQIELATAALPAGVYVVALRSASGRSVKKIVLK